MVAYIILCNFVLFVGFLTTITFWQKKKQDGRMGEKKEGTKYSALEKIWKKQGKNSRLATILSEIKDAMLENKNFF